MSDKKDETPTHTSEQSPKRTPTEMPERLANFAKAADLDVVVRRSNRAELVYELQCRQCRAAPWLSIVSYEAAEFWFCGGQFRNGTPHWSESEMELRCKCPERRNELPQDFQMFW